MKAIIFDMDGVIIDSEHIHFEVERNLLEELGGTFDEEVLNSFVGSTDYDIWSTFKEDFNFEMPLKDIIELKKERFIDNLDRIPLIEGVKGLMSDLSEKGYSLALASSNNRKSVDAIVKKFGLGQYLDYSISGDDVENGKPDPEVFLTAAKELGVKASDCLVIEDAENGVEAAKAAGMKVIGFKNPNSGDLDFSKADLVVDSYNELSIDVLKGLF